ncbi:hypothetical protein PC128_g13747 [Phytophthora cactorum]|nr:hypothetical protein PC128_g13747 [Phytophthora cactorum]KAG4039077.1 hypothetical protein PC123_g25363 [Phytophthora cactorum]
MKAFYEIRRKCDAWLADMDWVLSSKWESMLSTPELFDEETDTDGLLPCESGEKHKEIAKDVARILGEACLGSMFRLSGGEATVKADHLVGMLARERILSDIIIDFCIRCICNSVGEYFAIDSYAPKFGCPTPPVTSISMFQYAVLLVHLSNMHWGIIMVRMNYHQDPPTFTPYFYEPLCSGSYRASMEDTYEETVSTFLRDWHNSSMPTAESSVESSAVWFDAPTQPDGTSCGVLCIAQAYAMLRDSFSFSRTAVTPDDVAVMRLKILWMIISQPAVKNRSNKLEGAVNATDKALLATIMK